MKTWILAAAMIMGLSLSAQPKDEKHEPLKPEQRAELQVKKLTLALDLNDKQQKELKDLFTAKAKEHAAKRAEMKAKREAGAKPTADERFAMQNKRLDEQIAMKKDLKRILSPEQYNKWEILKHERKEKITKHRENFKKRARR